MTFPQAHKHSGTCGVLECTGEEPQGPAHEGLPVRRRQRALGAQLGIRTSLGDMRSHCGCGHMDKGGLGGPWGAWGLHRVILKSERRYWPGVRGRSSEGETDRECSAQKEGQDELQDKTLQGGSHSFDTKAQVKERCGRQRDRGERLPRCSLTGRGQFTRPRTLRLGSIPPVNSRRKNF